MRLDEAARLFMGVKFRHQGRNPQVGIDCIGLLVMAATVCGLPQVESDYTGYGRDPFDGELEARMADLFGPMLPTSEMQGGDIAVIRFARVIRHVGIIGEHPHGLSLIHTNMAVGRVTEARIDDKWAKRIAGVYRP
jgi:hypothetical protein